MLDLQADNVDQQSCFLFLHTPQFDKCKSPFAGADGLQAGVLVRFQMQLVHGKFEDNDTSFPFFAGTTFCPDLEQTDAGHRAAVRMAT